MKKRSNIINFVLTIDKNYVQQSTVTITSILCNLNSHYKANFYIFFKGYKTKPIEFKQLEKQYKCSIFCIDVLKYEKTFSNQIESKNENFWVSIATYYRLLMFKFLPSKVEYAIYVDADIIVDGDLSNIYIDFIENKRFFASVADIYFYKIWSWEKKYYSQFNEFNKLANDKNATPYFCAGFYIANIKECKKLNVYEQMISFLKHHPNPKLADQDVLNAVFSQKYSSKMHYLHPKYDTPMNNSPIHYLIKNKYFYTRKIIKESFKHPIVLHYAGKNKPWINNRCYFGNKKWWFYYDKSPATMTRIKKVG